MIKNDTSKKIYIIIISILFIISIILIGINVTLTLLGNRNENNGIIQFKQHKLDIEVVGNESIVLTTEELTQGSNVSRTLKISNPNNSTSCVFRIWMEFLIENEVDDTYLSLEMDETRFTKSDSGKFYYNYKLNSNSVIDNVELKFSVATNLPSTYQGKEYNMKIYVESIQSTKIAVQDWSDDYNPAWYETIKNNLT